MLITRRVDFSASHRCASPQLDDNANLAVYGNEANLRGHGHNYALEVTLSGDADPVTGMVIDLKIVKSILDDEIVGPMDHRHLNHEVPPFDRVVPTAENLAIEVWRRLEPRFSSTPARLHRVRLYEGEDLYVDYEGPR
ncbi:MAG TPA: 6-carboxytetrahydropterin synthase [Bryobacteraceae bacterium]|nr:6-carboxytetrahydropterin synthase [Bryobacteraceae bacterium]HPT27935.1 6-carboxytetrahydropterin synthase [Bryobacteraceae bacterium]